MNIHTRTKNAIISANLRDTTGHAFKQAYLNKVKYGVPYPGVATEDFVMNMSKANIKRCCNAWNEAIDNRLAVNPSTP